MGCGSSKGDVIRSASAAAREVDKVVKTTVKPAAANGGGKNGVANGTSTKTSNSTVASSGGASTIPASDPYRNGSSLGRPLGHLPPLKPPRVGKNGSQDEAEPNQNKPNVPIAFEVPADDPGGGGDSSLIKRHPPRRLRKLVELQPDESSSSSLTHATIEEKVQQANQRRNQVLTQRVASARQKSARIRRPFMDPGGLTLNEFDGEIETGDKEEFNAPDGLQ